MQSFRRTSHHHICFLCITTSHCFCCSLLDSPSILDPRMERQTAAFEETTKKMVSTTDPARLTADQRLDEIAEILASGILRLRIKSAQHYGNKENLSLDNGNRPSPYVTVRNPRERRTEP